MCLQMLPELSVAGDLSYSSRQTVPRTRGPATAKLLSPRVVRIRIRVKARVSVWGYGRAIEHSVSVSDKVQG